MVRCATMFANLTFFIFGVAALATTPVWASEPEWYRSDKETDSFFESDWNRDNLALAYHGFAIVWKKHSAELMGALNGPQNAKLCEEMILEQWFEIFKTELPNFSRSQLLSFIQFLRAQNLIDDLVYYPLKKSFTAWETQLGLYVPRPVDFAAYERMTDSEKVIENEMRNPQFCFSQSFRKWMPKSVNAKTRRKNYQNAREFLGKQNADAVSWFDALYASRWDESKLSLSLVRSYAVPGERPKPPRNKSSEYIPYGPSEYSSIKSPKNKKQSIRMDVYERVGITGWIAIDDLWLKFIKRRDLNAVRKETIQYADGTFEKTVNEYGQPADEFRKLSQQDKFSRAVQDLNYDLNSSDLLRKMGVDFSDAVMVGIEMGRIKPSEVDSFVKLAQSWETDSKTGGFLFWVKRFGMPLISFASPPWNLMGTFVMAASDYIGKKKTQTPSARSRGVTRD
ncbi:MAG: hypothetical protein EOP04_20025 [Proteobacteria bacterium]|nr:MAG: hypothetical protein EOP04_20025 [Pseudomonadota bacterium]